MQYLGEVEWYVELIMKDAMEWHESTQSWPSCEYIFGIILEKLSKITESLS
jgi:hypothetical protein